MINRYWKGFFILVAENGVHLGSLESISRDIYLTSLPVLHKLLTFLRSILQVTKGILKRARVIMALQADQVQIKTIAHLYAITKREHNLARQCDNDVTPIFKSSWRWTGVEFCRWPTGSLLRSRLGWSHATGSVFFTSLTVDCNIDFLYMFRVRLEASGTILFEFNANWRRRVVYGECFCHSSTSGDKIDLKKNFKDMGDLRSHEHHLSSYEGNAWKNISG